ncbi:MAG TPA: hypothetical protein VJI46_07040 [Candidatus Nanoarchaeia archaeon]|nr:hypothetical protein [Candidatus Nanoarchaeia archaeon]
MFRKAEISRGTSTDIYFSCIPDADGTFEQQANSIFSEINSYAMHILYERIFLSKAGFVGPVREAREKFYAEFGITPPAASYITAPPANGAMAAMVAIGVKPENDNSLKITSSGGFYNSSTKVEYDGFEQLYFGNAAGNLHQGFVPQMRDSLFRMKEVMEQNGFDFKRDIVRTWFSITDINGRRCDGRTNYMDFNEHVRSPFLDELGFKGQYFASTGAGCGVNLDRRVAEISATAYKRNGSLEVIPMDNPLQTPVYRYAEGENPDKEKGNVKFERGMQVITPSAVLFIVSGTASIRGNKIVGDTLEDQTRCTLDNLRWLLDSYKGRLSDSKIAITYVKPGEDKSLVERIMEDNMPDAPRLIVFNELCYQKLKVETELIAAMPLDEFKRRKG